MRAFGLPALLAIALAIVCVASLTFQASQCWFSRSMKPPVLYDFMAWSLGTFTHIPGGYVAFNAVASPSPC